MLQINRMKSLDCILSRKVVLKNYLKYDKLVSYYWFCWFYGISTIFQLYRGDRVQHYVIKFVSGLRQIGGFLSRYSGFLHQ
jgi:hypothetical protein